MTDAHATMHSPFWWTIGKAELTWRCWDGDYVVFNSLSGHTHVLDLTTGRVLIAVAEGVGDIARLSQQIADFLEVEADAELGEAVARILSNLEDAGLVEPSDHAL